MKMILDLDTGIDDSLALAYAMDKEVFSRNEVSAR